MKLRRHIKNLLTTLKYRIRMNIQSVNEKINTKIQQKIGKKEKKDTENIYTQKR